jgi:hypothetical protein
MKMDMDSIKDFEQLKEIISQGFDKVNQRLDRVEQRIDRIEQLTNQIEQNNLKRKISDFFNSVNKEEQQSMELQDKKQTKIELTSEQQKTCNEMLELMKNMENGEKLKFLHELYYLHFNRNGDKYQPFDSDY